jgi:hypothetical protein
MVVTIINQLLLLTGASKESRLEFGSESSRESATDCAGRAEEVPRAGAEGWIRRSARLVFRFRLRGAAVRAVKNRTEANGKAYLHWCGLAPKGQTRDGCECGGTGSG